jgi:hypothetical protein
MAPLGGWSSASNECRPKHQAQPKVARWNRARGAPVFQSHSLIALAAMSRNFTGVYGVSCEYVPEEAACGSGENHIDVIN